MSFDFSAAVPEQLGAGARAFPDGVTSARPSEESPVAAQGVWYVRWEGSERTQP